MAELSSNRIAWTYTDDTGKDWRVAAVKALTDQGLLGGAPAASTVPPKPANIKMRRATGRTAGGVSRTFPLYDSSQTFAVDGAPGTINANVLEVSTPFVWGGGVIPEKRPRISVTTQST